MLQQYVRPPFLMDFQAEHLATGFLVPRFLEIQKRPETTGNFSPKLLKEHTSFYVEKGINAMGKTLK